jgi:hypothetical protein
MAVSPQMIERPAIWPVKVMQFYRLCRATILSSLRMMSQEQHKPLDLMAKRIVKRNAKIQESEIILQVYQWSNH